MKTQISNSQQGRAPLSRVSVGRIVNYVLADGQIRPLIVTRVRGDALGHVNGVLFFDGSNDAHVLPREHSDPAGQPCMLLTAVRYEASRSQNTWHWPEKV